MIKANKIVQLCTTNMQRNLAMYSLINHDQLIDNIDCSGIHNFFSSEFSGVGDQKCSLKEAEVLKNYLSGDIDEDRTLGGIEVHLPIIQRDEDPKRCRRDVDEFIICEFCNL
jgi:hypothetical protein